MGKTVKKVKGFLTGGVTVRGVTLDASMILLIPLTLWIIADVYVPVVGTGLNKSQAWGVAGITVVFMLISLAAHGLAHIVVSHNKSPKHVFLSPLGDPAQNQVPEATSGKETATAMAGPAIQFLLAGLFFWLWDLQINPFITLPAAFLIFFNLGLGAINLTPAFPFDGGRVLRAIFWKLLSKPETGTKLAERAGWGFIIFLTAWSIFLLVQQARFSLVTAGATLLMVSLTVISLLIYRSKKWGQSEDTLQRSFGQKVFGTGTAAVLALPLVAVALSMLPLNEGLEAPGFTASVAPMVELPEGYRTPSKGSFILVTVFPQAPIIFGEWVYAHFDHTIKLTPQEKIVGEDETVQSAALRDYGMLVDSETTAKIVGLQLAGYPAKAVNAGVRIDSILPESPAKDILQPDDIITRVNGQSVLTPADLTAIVQQLLVQSTLKMEIRRTEEVLTLYVPTMEPEPGGGVKIGIRIAPYITGYDLPVPVKITPQKVTGGPSAGLMFTLTIYDLLTEKDLTRGYAIAGTGTIDLAGNVGAIGGVQQKVAAAERAGAAYFLVPADNYADAAAAATNINIVKVTTAQEAIEFLEGLPEK